MDSKPSLSLLLLSGSMGHSLVYIAHSAFGSAFLLLILLLPQSVLGQERPADGCMHHHLAQMELPNLKTAVTSNAHKALMLQYDVRFHHLTLAVEANSPSISAAHVRTHAVVTGTTALDSFAVELASQLVVDSVFFNGQPAPYAHSASAPELLVFPNSAPSPGALFEVQIYYHGTPPTGPGGFFGGFFNDVDPDYGFNVTWTLSEPYDSRNWWPCKQVVSDKIDSVFVSIITSAHNKAGSNGMLVGTVPLTNGKVRYDWQHRHPIAYYLVSIAVANYQQIVNYAKPAALGGDSIPVVHYIYNTPQALVSNQLGADITPGLLEFFSERYGLYPFADEKYGHALAPMKGGAMEHQTMSTMTWLGADVITHELAHQWFGNYVTCGSWQDIFLNEGFATYSEYIARQWWDPQGAPAYMAEMQDEVERDPDGSTFVPDTSTDSRIFSYRLTYMKGACILHMLRFEINNDSLYFAILRNYLQNNANGTALLQHLRQEVEAGTGRSFQDFFDQWYYGEGYPIFDVIWNHDPSLNRLFVEISHNTSAPFVTNKFRTPIEVKVNYSNGQATTVRLLVTDTYNFFIVDNIPDGVTSLELDPNRWLLRKVNSVQRNNLLSINPMHPVNAAIGLGPNPGADYVEFFQLPAPHPHTVVLSNLLGQVVFRAELPAGQSRLTLPADLPSGIYALMLSNPLGTRTWRWARG